MWFLQNFSATEGKASVEISIDSKIRALAVLPHEIPRIVSGEGDTVQLRNLANAMIGERIESDTDVLAVAASTDGRWFVTGTTDGFTIWKMESSGGAPIKVAHRAVSGVRTIDISSDSKWVATGTDARTVDVWDVSMGEMRQVLGLKHEYNVVAVKFCPCGKRIATATLFGSIRIYATTSGKKLLTIPVSVTSTLSALNITLAWFPNRPHIFAVSQGQIKCLNSDDGSVVFQWATRGVSNPSSVTLSPNSKFIAYSVNRTVVIRDTVTHQQIGDTLQHGGNVSCLAFSLGSDRLVVGADTKFTIWDLGKFFKDATYVPDSTVTISRPESCMRHDQDTTQKPTSSTFSLPLMRISNAGVKPWLHGFLKRAEEVLSAEIDSPASPPNHDTLANRALVRGRLGYGFDEALKDAEQSLSIQKSAIGHIAKAKALILLRKEDLAKQEIQILHTFQSNTGNLKHEDTSLVKIIQSILCCLSGEEAIHFIKSSMDQKDKEQTKLLSLIQANMHLSKKDFDLAMESFKDAHVPTIFPHEESPEMWSLSFIFGWKFSGLGIQIQQEKCQSLLNDDSPKAAYLFLNIMKIYHREIVLHVKLSHWSTDFKKRCLEKLEGLGNKALDSHDYKKAIEHYTAVKPLMEDSESKHALLLKRSTAHLELGPENWGNALGDAEEAIGLNDLSPWGHERKHAVLYKLRLYREAAEALNQMIECLADSMDAKSMKLREDGVQPRVTKFNINQIIDDIFAPDQPRPIVLVNTKSGRLCDKLKQVEAFRADPEYKKLVLTPASQLKDDVKEILLKYFRYSTFSHTWEVDGDSEPKFGDVENTSVDRLRESVTNTKLQTFCKKTLDHGYLWAWSDTCCINQDDEKVLNLSLRSMYQWYFHSSLTIVHLKGVFQQLDDVDTPLDELLQEFVKCRWNQRAWTLQEYFASRVIQFYTEDWKPYLPIRHYTAAEPVNHKLCPTIQHGMYLVTGVDPVRLAALKAGDDDRDARQKLSLASRRKATKEEDIAYSLLGIFDVTIETIYGGEEVHRALGRLLGALLTKYADVTILAWTGKTSKYNTCLPAEITVYHDSDRHVPQLVEETGLVASIPNTRLSIPPAELESAVKLHNELVYSSPQVHHGRLHLPCIQFALKVAHRDSTSQISTITSPLLVDKIQIKTADDVSSRRMVLVHPWFRRLLDAPIAMSDSAQALRFLAALRQRFGALLLAWNLTSGAYERIAAEQFIEAQIRDDVSPGELLGGFMVLQIR